MRCECTPVHIAASRPLVSASLFLRLTACGCRREASVDEGAAGRCEWWARAVSQGSTIVSAAPFAEQYSFELRPGTSSGNGPGLLSEQSASQHSDQGLVSFIVLDRQASFLDCCFKMLWTEKQGCSNCVSSAICSSIRRPLPLSP